MPDMYSDNPGEESPVAPEKEETKQEDDGGEVALLPKSLMAGKDFEPGQEIVLEVVEVYEDEFSVRYAKEDKEESNPDMENSMKDLDNASNY